MQEYWIVICKGCGRKFRLYSMAVYRGDPSYCPQCNRESGESRPTPYAPDRLRRIPVGETSSDESIFTYKPSRKNGGR